MSRADGSTYPPYPSDADWWETNEALHRESDELPDPADYEDSATWVITSGDVIQPHCMCGRWSSTAECEDCQKTLEEFRFWAEEERRNRAERVAWRRLGPVI